MVDHASDDGCFHQASITLTKTCKNIMVVIASTDVLSRFSSYHHSESSPLSSSM